MIYVFTTDDREYGYHLLEDVMEGPSGYKYSELWKEYLAHLRKIYEVNVGDWYYWEVSRTNYLAATKVGLYGSEYKGKYRIGPTGETFKRWLVSTKGFRTVQFVDFFRGD